MKILIHLLIALVFVCAGSLQMQAQGLSKEEAKEWKNAAKEYKKNPAALKNLTEECDRYQEEAAAAEERIQTIQSQLMQEKERNANLQEERDRLRNELMVTRQTNQTLMEQIQELEEGPVETAAPPEEDFTAGTIFSIQVGAFKRVPARFNQYPDMFVEEDGGLKKVLLGKYRDFERAKARLNQLKREGFRGAWVVGYVDGRRVSLKEALAN